MQNKRTKYQLKMVKYIINVHDLLKENMVINLKK